MDEVAESVAPLDRQRLVGAHGVDRRLGWSEVCASGAANGCVVVDEDGERTLELGQARAWLKRGVESGVLERVERLRRNRLTPTAPPALFDSSN